METDPTIPGHAELEELRARNAATMKRLAEIGVRVQGVHVDMRREMLIDRALGTKGKARLAFEVEFESDLAEMLEENEATAHEALAQLREQLAEQERMQRLVAGTPAAATVRPIIDAPQG